MTPEQSAERADPPAATLPDVRAALHAAEVAVRNACPAAEITFGPIEFLVGERVQVHVTVAADLVPAPQGDDEAVDEYRLRRWAGLTGRQVVEQWRDAEGALRARCTDGRTYVMADDERIEGP